MGLLRQPGCETRVGLCSARDRSRGSKRSGERRRHGV